MKYWNNHHQEAIIQYVMCVSASTSASTRHYIFNHILYQPLHLISKTTLFKVNSKIVNDDNIQSQLLYVYENVLSKLNTNSKLKDNMNAAYQFIYLSLYRNAINIARYNEIRFTPSNSECQRYEYQDVYIDEGNKDNADVVDARIEINNYIDTLVKKMKYVSKPSVILLLHLQQYIIDNEYDARGFRKYVTEKMNINKCEYSAIITKIGIDGKILREKLITPDNFLVRDNYSSKK